MGKQFQSVELADGELGVNWQTTSAWCTEARNITSDSAAISPKRKLSYNDKSSTIAIITNCKSKRYHIKTW